MSLRKAFSTKVSCLFMAACIAFLVIGCSDSPAKASDPVQPPEESGMAFSLLASSISATDTTLNIKVSWKAPVDAYGAPEYYLHTMTSSKLVTDSISGPLPTNKRVDGLVDTVRVRLAAINDTVTLTASIRSYRRGLTSIPAIGKLFIRRGDKAPPPPDSVTVDTIVVPTAPAISMNRLVSPISIPLITIDSPEYISLFARESTGTTSYKVKNTTYLTLIVK